ncbi:murein hydrolase activator EnvC family protein [Melghirimyces algeriensis]|uniref:Septal ring factor EnvC, activator of murein hydrolases AmiA and AmiB n=1 Tax=Melghirimyces algeriensis TaxID=910412 RepID=A0A521D1K2_9BACL|nr:M23 family metallopeptidase [Melghirimyces algeriensis]SMO65564.1 Septal ring factor EnvC, activator of murein hydrolases AmiA and AmiB [Melghirimyces algeriensis]
MKRKLFTKLVCGWTSLIVGATLLSPVIIHAEKIEEKKENIKKRDKEIQQLEKEKAYTKKELKSIFAELEEKKRKLAKLDKEVFSLEKKLRDKKKKLKKKETRINEMKQLYEGRLRTIYQQGDMFYIESVLNAKNLDQFISRLSYIRIVEKRDRELIKRYQQDQVILKKEKEKYEKLLADRKKKAKKAHSIHSRLIKDYKEHEKQIQELAKEKEHLEEANEEERKQIRDMVRKQQQQSKSKSSTYDGGTFARPVKGEITSTYGMRYHPIRKTYKMHTGVDFGASLGTPIYAAAGGKVIQSRPSTGYGYIVVIDHGGGLSTLYAHMYAQDVNVSVGQTVSKGQKIAEVGNNGWSTGPHLHFEVLKNGEHTDPMPYLK